MGDSFRYYIDHKPEYRGNYLIWPTRDLIVYEEGYTYSVTDIYEHEIHITGEKTYLELWRFRRRVKEWSMPYKGYTREVCDCEICSYWHKIKSIPEDEILLEAKWG